MHQTHRALHRAPKPPLVPQLAAFGLELAEFKTMIDAINRLAELGLGTSDQERLGYLIMLGVDALLDGSAQ